MKLYFSESLTPLRRLYRRIRGQCVVCGNTSGRKRFLGFWFCSYTCAILDGCMTLKMDNPDADENGWIRKPSLFYGRTERKKSKEDRRMEKGL